MASKSLSKLQQRMRVKLDGGRFRWINEQLYTTEGKHSYQLFQEDPRLFDVYHTGFACQVRKWPINPLDLIIARIKKRHAHAVVGDFGCGEARLAQSVPNKVYSFDLVAANKYITACDLANVPLANDTLDVGVFCLALMGTNYVDFLMEARRVLKPKGKLYVAEVRSRIETGSDDNTTTKHTSNVNKGVQSFLSMMDKLGFKCDKTDTSNKMFILMEFRLNSSYRSSNEDAPSVKNSEEVEAQPSKTRKRRRQSHTKANTDKHSLKDLNAPSLKACRYKKR